MESNAPPFAEERLHTGKVTSNDTKKIFQAHMFDTLIKILVWQVGQGIL
jgi:hypothetical protein